MSFTGLTHEYFYHICLKTKEIITNHFTFHFRKSSSAKNGQQQFSAGPIRVHQVRTFQIGKALQEVGLGQLGSAQRGGVPHNSGTEIGMS